MHATTDEVRTSFASPDQGTFRCGLLTDCSVQVRDWLVPINKRWNLNTLMGTLRPEFQKDNKRRRRNPLSVEYVMLRGVNDSLDDARRLAEMVQGMSCAVNLIGFNSHDGTLFEPTPEEQVHSSCRLTFRGTRDPDGIMRVLKTGECFPGCDEGAWCPFHVPRKVRATANLHSRQFFRWSDMRSRRCADDKCAAARAMTRCLRAASSGISTWLDGPGARRRGLFRMH